MKNQIACAILLIMISACDKMNTQYKSFDEYPIPKETSLWNDYTKDATTFKLWSPNAEAVKVLLFVQGDGGESKATHELQKGIDGVWLKKVEGDLNGTYYTYQVKIDGNWQQETPGIYAQAVGVNGQRAMVIDLATTNPEGWENNAGPTIKSPNEAIIYELHVRDLTIHPNSGSSAPGKFLGLVEAGTTGPEGVATGIDHIKELGITHVHLLPSYDHYSIDETKLDSAQFNWGYDPQNYNVPEGSFSSDPYNAEVRIREFKTMVKSFHENGIGVILDVVYNHTGRTEDSNFNLENPGYYYRNWPDGSLADASACGNETASDRTMMRRFIVESVAYWAEEYHLDGFRFDLMGIHDISTMNEVTQRLKEINPNIFVYGEGWTAADSPLPVEDRALKKNTLAMPGISAFSDDLRDGLKGSVFEDESKGFVSGAIDTEQSILFGVVGSIDHPQIDYAKVNYSNEPWTSHPWQAISYVSCHDNHTLYDKLKISTELEDEDQIAAMDKLAAGIVLTSQGTSFLHAGSELLRTKKNEHNSYNLPDSYNQIDWNWKISNKQVFDFYKNLIDLRKTHPAFRMINGEDVRKNLEFKEVQNGLISYQISNNANGDEWKNILVFYNARTSEVNIPLTEPWQVAVESNDFYTEDEKTVNQSIELQPISLTILFQK